jgi:hypothetical protein
VYRNLMFMSAEANNGRVDCAPGGVPDTVSANRMRGVRIFDISDIKNPKLVANVQTCRGSHTHTVLEDPKDKENVYIYVSGSAGIRSPELAVRERGAGREENSSLCASRSSRSRSRTRQRPRSGESREHLRRTHGDANSTALSEADKAAAARKAARRTRGRRLHRPKNPQSGSEMVVGGLRALAARFIMKARGGTGTPTAADTATFRANSSRSSTRCSSGTAADGTPDQPDRVSAMTSRSIRRSDWPAAPAKATACCSTSAIR